jgi:CRP-like cAMP-binding protein|tara:strand:- start:71 stop:946 length:876 start_codon:yes stop_codon:yes gene_type:complete
MAGKSDRVTGGKRRRRERGKVGAGGAPGDCSARDIEFFSSFSNVERRRVERTLEWRGFAKGETILNEHETSDDVYFIAEGNVGVLGFAESGRVISYASLEPGEYFGELAAIDKQPRSATVIANAPSVIAVLPGAKFRRLIKSNPKIACAVMEKLARVIRLSNLHVIDLSDLRVQQRICLELLRLAEPGSGDSRGWRVHPLPTQQEMAMTIGSTRESVGRILSQLSRSGIVHRESRILHVPDLRKLEEMVLPGNRRSEGRRSDRERRKDVFIVDNEQRSADDRRIGDRRNAD